MLNVGRKALWEPRPRTGMSALAMAMFSVRGSGFSRSLPEDEIPLQCGLRLNPCFADNTAFLKRRLKRLVD
jgi:hypothetical protein